MSKTSKFLSDINIQTIIKLIYQKHVDDGGQKLISTFIEQIPHLMANWNKTPLLDSYESIAFDEVSEIEAINLDFISTYWPLFSVGDDYKNIKALNTPEDYHNLDTTKTPDLYTQTNIYRDKNAFPVWQRSRYKYMDRTREGNGMQGHSIELVPTSCGNMEDYLVRTNIPYAKIDNLDIPYYGQSTNEGVSALTSTMWKTTN